MLAFHWFSRKKKIASQEEEKVELPDDLSEISEVNEEFLMPEKENVDFGDPKARAAYLDRLEETMQEAERHCESIKTEYGLVTSYLRDIQLLDQAPAEEKTDLNAAARRILELNRERQRLQGRKYKITEAQEHIIEKYENEVEKDIGNWKEYEHYQMQIKNDLRQLTGEKHLLVEDQKDIIQRQNSLKMIGKVLVVVLVAMGAMMLSLLFLFKVDITVPFIATAAFAFVIAAVILSEARKNRIDMVITEKKCNRAIFLTNRVKIKYINNVRTLDYMSHKYRMRNVTELDFVYGQYRKMKREWEKQLEMTMRLKENHGILLHELERLGVKDREIWLSQAEALVNPKEMVEVRHDLNVRRQKMREQLDYNMNIMGNCIQEMEKLKGEYERK